MDRHEQVGDLSIGEPGNVYLLRSRINCRFRGDVDQLHVMSRSAGGQVRGYARPHGARGAWSVSTPAYEGNWVAMDLAVSTLIGEAVRGCDGIARRAVAKEPPRPKTEFLKMQFGALVRHACERMPHATHVEIYDALAADFSRAGFEIVRAE